MSHDDIIKKFQADLKDEIQDSNVYMDMAEAAEKDGDERLMRGLYEMSKDEYTHAKFIHETLIMCGVAIPMDQTNEFKNLEKRIYWKFR